MTKRMLLERMNREIFDLASCKQLDRHIHEKVHTELFILSTKFEQNNHMDMSVALKRIIQRLEILGGDNNINREEVLNELQAYSFLIMGLIEAGQIWGIPVSGPLKAEYVSPAID